MTKKNADHVLMHDGSDGFWGFECTHCGQRQELPRRVLLPVMVAASEAFLEMHRDCEPGKVG